MSNGGRWRSRSMSAVALTLFLVGAALATVVPARAAGAAGDVVLGFGSCGVARTTLLRDDGQPTATSADAVAVQPNGAIVVVGSGGLYRLLPHGGVDVSFGRNVGVSPRRADGIPRLVSVALQPDGRVVAAGSLLDHVTHVPRSQLLVRYLADGTPDRSFGDAGQVVVGPSGYLSVLAVQPDGKLVAGGDWGLVRVDSTGRPDPGFGSGGTVSGVANGPVVALAVQPDGRLVVGLGAGSHFRLARFDADGSLDPTFGSGGVAKVESDSGNDNLTAVAIDGAGRILSAGSMTTLDRGWPAIGLTRHLPNGQLDSTFGDGGRELTYLPGFESSAAADLVLQSDGKPVVTVRVGTRSSLVLARFGPNGGLDPTFGTNGFSVTRFEDRDGALSDLEPVGDDGWVAVGWDRSGPAVVRYRGDSPSPLDAGVTTESCARAASLTPLAGEGFGSVVVRSRTSSRSFRFTATGTAAVRVSRVGFSRLDSAFVLTSDGCTGARLAPGASCTVSVAFAPNTPGKHDAALVVWADTGIAPRFVIIHGEAMASPMGWGWNGVGQLGSGTEAVSAVPGIPSGLVGVVAIATGFHHTLALTGDGRVFAWGWNHFGQLGDGTNVDRHRPVAVLTGVRAIAAGGFHSLAVLADGTVASWGLNHVGQLGRGATPGTSVPAAVPGLTGVGAVSAGGYHSLALKTDGTVSAWGWNVFGQLGDGTTADRGSPRPVPGLTGVSAVSAGSYHNLVLAGGVVSGWGLNHVGQLGDGTTTGRLRPVPVPGLSGVSSVAAGSFHNLAVVNGDRVFSWGWNAYGQLGNGTTSDRLRAAAVGTTTAQAVAAGLGHSLALQADGAVKAWGWNVLGQLGDGTTTTRARPVVVAGLRGMTSVSAGALHSIAN